jgi:hypothetical protein
MGRSSRVRAGCILRRCLLLLPLLAPAGCQSISARVGQEFSLEEMRAKGNALVLFHTTLHTTGCMQITLSLAQPDGQGRWARGEQVTVKGMFDMEPQPSQMILPPGEYGIVHLTCHLIKEQYNYVSRMVQRPNPYENKPALYDQPFATFRVSAGEVVDIGSLTLVTGEGVNAQGRWQSVFFGVARPIPERFAANFAAKHPGIYNMRVVRPMVTPPLPPGVRLNGAPAG